MSNFPFTRRASMRTTALTAAGCAACLLAGCATPIARSVVNANLAQEQAANQLLLLNIARAHERMPMHFSQIGQIRSAPGGWGLGVPSLGLELPFGGTADGYKMTVGNEGQSPVDVTAMASQEFMRGMTTPLTADAMAYFANQGWSTALLMHLFFESITQVNKSGDLLLQLKNDPGSRGYGRFREFVDKLSACELVADLEDSEPRYLSSAVEAVSVADGVEVGNAKLRLLEAPLPARAASATGYRLAAVSQEAVLRLRTPAPTAKEPSDKPDDPKADELCRNGLHSLRSVDEKAEGPEGPEGRTNKPDPSMLLFQAQTARVGSAAAERGRQEARAAAALPRASALTSKTTTTWQFVLRSPEAMLYYLGQLSRAQNGGWLSVPPENRRPTPLTLQLADDRRGVLFHMSVENGEHAPAETAVQVRYADKTFAVAKPGNSYDKSATAPEDRSMTTLSLMQVILGLQDKGAETPGVSNVRVFR